MDTEKLIIVDFANYGGGNAPSARSAAGRKMRADVKTVRAHNKGRKNKISVAEYRDMSPQQRAKIDKAVSKNANKSGRRGNATTASQKKNVGQNAAAGRAKAKAKKGK